MTKSLRDVLISDEESREAFVVQARAVLDDEVRSKRGPTGVMLKGAYKTVNAVHATFVNGVIRVLLPDFLDRMQPHWDAFASSGQPDFGQFLAGQGDEAADALLAVVDARAEASSYRSVAKLYGQLRGQGHKHVVLALPAVGALIQREMRKSV
ncbi:hypothetical protein ONR57_19455 [Hoyosella sp. YIM 151337]|uniref:DUF6918 family protein n=1 Tax=Hoyosella sp. YIM 151337 TaxID=2992742 RepID=UPI0022360D4D|nr:hypothetical protein [Hoyosella sp. YIM 151337]MCW4355484.1 hypothetical protein [Hoyosella sp. YIM 151337]